MIWDSLQYVSNTLYLVLALRLLSLYYLIRAQLLTDLAVIWREILTDHRPELNLYLFAFETQATVRLLDWGMPHNSFISITLDSFVLIFLSQTMEFLIGRISSDAGAIIMFAEPHIQYIRQITFTHLSRVQTLSYEAQKIILVQCGIFKHVFYQFWRLISSENASLLLFALRCDCLFSHIKA